MGNKTKTQLLRRERVGGFFFSFYLELEGASQMFHPFISTSTNVFLLGVDFIPQQMDGRIRSSPHYTPLLPLIVNSVNEVNLINFRAGSHMTFSSIFSPTSKTSISSSKMERSDWRSPITPTYLKPRVNLFSSFECVHYNCVFKEDLEIAKKLKSSPRNVQKLFFPPSLFLFFNPMSIAQPQWMTQSIVVLHFLFLIRTDHNSHRSWNPIP